jgi:MoaD family protein
VIRVRLFAVLREMAGASVVEVDAADVRSLMARMEERLGPRFTELMAAGTVVVNGEAVGTEGSLGPEDEVALLPPVSGG